MELRNAVRYWSAIVSPMRRIPALLTTAVSLLIAPGLTFIAYHFVAVNSTTAALTFLLAVLAVATWWGLRDAVVASISGWLCFNYFFLDPVGTFTIAHPQDWVAFFAFSRDFDCRESYVGERQEESFGSDAASGGNGTPV